MLPSAPAIAANPTSLRPIHFNFLKTVAPALLAASVLLSGCGKKNSTTQSPPPETASAPAAAHAATPAAPVGHAPVAQAMPANAPAIAANASAAAVTDQLSAELRRYVAYTRTIPKSFEEFIAHDPIKFPPAPAGKKYVINGAQVVLE